MTFHIQWRSNEGYGDFVGGMAYAHSPVIKYKQPVTINFHWPNVKDSYFSSLDNETILYRFNHILSFMRPVKGLNITHTFSSIPTYRFINQLEEFNYLHGLWYPKHELKTTPKLVVHWSSKHNVTFPGYHKDPAYDIWDDIVDRLLALGYDVREVTYRTPIKKVLELIANCEFGVGYEGMIHQLFKFMWKPLVVASQRKSLAKLLAPQGYVITDPKLLLSDNILDFVNISKQEIIKYKDLHYKYMHDYQDPTLHPLYNKEI